MFRCNYCKTIFDILVGKCPNGCKFSVKGVVDASGLTTANEISKSFEHVEQHDVQVGEVILSVDVLARLDTEDVTEHEGQMSIVGDNGLTNRHLWLARVRVVSPRGTVLIWDET